jgi:hypothetical protein
MADLSAMNFDTANEEAADGGFVVVPPGVYTVMVVKSDVKDTKNGTGKKLEMQYQIVTGQHAGTMLTDRLNIKNASADAERIGRGQLKSICDAIGYVGVLKDSSALHGKPFSVQVIVEDFESSNTAGKILQSNKVQKRMKKTTEQAGAAPKAANSGW